MIKIVAEVKGWAVEQEWEEVVEDVNQWGVVRRLEANWRVFEHGNHTPVVRKKKRGDSSDHEEMVL
jgi:hypothetical protein